MLQIEFKQCCKECKNIDVDIQSEMCINAIAKDYVYVIIGCKHQFVCKEYREQPEVKRLVKP